MNKRVDGLNFIRILGMTMILFFHAWLIYGFSTDNVWLNQMFSLGAIFVTVFIMLSGFGLRKSNSDLSVSDFSGVLKFYKKRILAIYPIFLLLTITALLFQYNVADSQAETLSRLPIQFSMLHILWGKDMHSFLFNDNCWYISALFVLYLLFPFLNEVVNRLRTWMKICLCVVLWIVSIGVYFYLVYCTELIFLDYYPNPFLRIPEFMIGMMLADLSEKDILESGWLCAILFGAIALIANIALPILFPHFNYETNLYDILVIPCTSIVFLSIANWEWLNRIGSLKIFRWLAGLGLEMYLCQSFAMLVLARVMVDGQLDEYVFIGLTVVFAVVVNTVFSRPINRMARGKPSP